MPAPVVHSIEELCEKILIGALKSNATLSALTFRNADDGDPSFTDGVIVKAAAPEPRLEGERGYKVVVHIELKSATPEVTDLWHQAALKTVVNATALTTGAAAAGLSSADDLTILNEEIGGDRANTKHTRKRAITVPLIIQSSTLT